MRTDSMLAALAVGAHPDDVEFMMSGTLELLRRVGAEVHVWSMTDGCLGSLEEGRGAAAVRIAEASASSDLAQATFHPPIASDMGLSLDRGTLARAAAVIRKARPRVMLVPSPSDYHPDHEAASRIAVAAALVRAMPALVSDPAEKPWDGQVTVYHAMPHGLEDPMRARVRAGQYVDISDVMDLKRKMLAAHASQRELLLATQGEEPVVAMDFMAAEVGAQSGRFELAEGWRRHSHIGLSHEDSDPLGELLGSRCWTDPDHEASLG